MKLPGESAEYRAARDALLKEEAELRLHMERVAEQRRALPLGGAVKDYVFQRRVAGVEEDVHFADLFEDGHDTLFVYNFMFGPNMEAPCRMCTSAMSALNAQVHYLHKRISTAIVASRPVADFEAYAAERGWTQLNLLSSGKTEFNADYSGQTPDGHQLPMAHVFVKRNGTVHHFWSSELFFVPGPDGMQPRHVDAMWPLWNVLDWTPAGRGAETGNLLKL